MSHPDAIAALYDHEQELATEHGRLAPDWGGDELFTTTPRRRRFEREDRQRSRPVESWFVEDADLAALVDGPAPDHLADEHALTAELEPAAPRPARRTVTVTGHPDAAVRTQRAVESRRRRPAPSLDDRIGHRPDRIAAWAFALGLLLILIAVATANAATL